MGLQNENTKLTSNQQDLYKCKVSNLEDIQKIHADRDQLVLELEESRNKLNNANQVKITIEKIPYIKNSLYWVFSVIFTQNNTFCIFRNTMDTHSFPNDFPILYRITKEFLVQFKKPVF